jgi:hypothetical protein
LASSSRQKSHARQIVGIYGRTAAACKLMETTGPYVGSFASVGLITLKYFVRGKKILEPFHEKINNMT